ncbi:MAG: sodium:solute symporter family transporter [Phycisphaerae bacterium]
MGIYDYLILGFYFIFIFSIGLVFRRYSRDISDYFRGGGTMLWWMSGASALLGALSVWSFTGAAGEIYDAGTLILLVYWSSVVVGVFIWLVTCYRFRRMRVITPVHAIQRRYGPTTEQLYLWVQLPLGLFMGGLGLNTLAVFISSAFHTNFLATMVVVGVIVMLVSAAGGAWSVVAGDFVQMLIMFSVVLVAAFLALRQSAIGGLTGLLHKLPADKLNWTLLERPGVLIFWGVALTLQTFMTYNDLSQGAAKFMTVKNEAHARKAALLLLVVYIVLPLILMIPPLAAIILFPHLKTQFPNLTHPHEGAYVAVCMKVMPQGMLGLLVSAMFATAMANMDTGLNRNAGNFVQNFYQQFLRPKATQTELLAASRITTLILGMLIIGIGLLIAKFRTMNLFNFVIIAFALVGPPITVPMVLGLFIRRTPSWAGWSTIIVGFFISALMYWGFNPDWIKGLLGVHHAYNEQERDNVVFAAQFIAEVGVASLWYWFTMRFAARSSPEYQRSADAFFADMKRPIDPMAEGLVYDDTRQYRVLSRMCLVYGGVVLLGMLIPNNLTGRLCFGFIGGVIVSIGILLLIAERRSRRPVPESQSPDR